MDRPSIELNAVEGREDPAKHIVMVRYAIYPANAERIPVALPDFLVTRRSMKNNGKFTTRNVPVLMQTSASRMTSSFVIVKKTLNALFVSILPIPSRVIAK
jgi:hypothetical protein